MKARAIAVSVGIVVLILLIVSQLFRAGTKLTSSIVENVELGRPTPGEYLSLFKEQP